MYPTGLAISVNTKSSSDTTAAWDAIMGEQWAKSYRPERKANWRDIAQAIRDTVTMGELVAMYCPGLSPRQNRCPCPIHNGKDYNFSFTPHGYKCFVCGASGDVVSFVKEVCELSTRSDAMKLMDADFHLNLPINGTLSAIQSANLALKTWNFAL